MSTLLLPAGAQVCQYSYFCTSKASKVEEHLAVASQGVLQHLRELRVAIGHVFVLVRERRHHVMQRRERAVDVLGLLRAGVSVFVLFYQ